MKFQKGLLSDLAEKPKKPADADVAPARQAAPPAAVLQDDRLFETLEEESGSERKYLRVIGVVIVLILIIGGAVFYLTLPKIGDPVRAPKGLEQSIRDHFLTVEKREATDVTVYFCGSYYWARVGVVKRTDIKTNPIYMIDTYKAQATAGENDTWTITAAPITSPEMDKPCS